MLVPDGLYAQIVSVTDIGLETSYQDTLFFRHKRGRAGIAADFNLDGRTDYFIGNPGDESFILRNVQGPGRAPRFIVEQVLLVDSLAWGGVSFDYDNDGDYDLFIPCGANEGIGYDILFRNDWIHNGEVTGELSFTDVTAIAGVAGPLPDASPIIPVRTASANAVVADYDQDGDNDLFVNGNIHEISDPNYPELIGRNTLWRNNGDGTFTDVTEEAGLADSLFPTRHSTFVDIDNDGDPDLYENNFRDPNVLWRNNDDGTFTDITAEASAPGHDLHYPLMTFVSAAADLNNDGWEDLIGFMRGLGAGQEFYGDGHALYLNSEGVFENVAPETIINDNYVGPRGVMGSMVGDVSGDGFPDIFIGNGGPPNGVANQFYVSIGGNETLAFEDKTFLIDFPATIPEGMPIPSYPYRTHGTTFVDLDNDGFLEIAVVNGGPQADNPEYEEPNRLFKLELERPYNWFKVRPVGDGIAVAKDAIGTRICLDVSNATGETWSVYRTLFAGSAFSAQNGFVLHFGLADADTIEHMRITWPNGETTNIESGLKLNSSVVVQVDGQLDVVTGHDSRLDPVTEPLNFSLEQAYPNPFQSSTTIAYTLAKREQVTIEVYDLLGRHITTLVDEMQGAGSKKVDWRGTDQFGKTVANGVYFYKMTSGNFVLSHKVVLVK